MSIKRIKIDGAIGMRGEQRSQFGFGDDLIASRVPSDHWLMQLDRLVDWKAFEPVLGSLYSPTGRPSHPPRVMCKMLLLEQGFNLSDAEVEMQARMRIDFLCFPGLSLAEPVADATALVRFRQRLLADRVGKLLFDRVIDQLAVRGMIIRRGTLIDASMGASARQSPPQGGSGRSDREAGWAVKGGNATHGCKAHAAVDAESDMVRCVITTPGNVHDAAVADGLVSGDEVAVYADKACCDEGRRHRLRAEGMAPRILDKGRRNAPLTAYQRSINKRWSVVRSQVERIFADWKVRRSLRRCRQVGLMRNPLHITLLAMAHNLRRMLVLARPSPPWTA